VGALPVLDGANKLLGILSYVDVLMWLSRAPRLTDGTGNG
jgi:CBS-domain-containing membrane protein